MGVRTWSAWVRRLTPASTFELSVRAVDGAGNASASSNVVGAATNASSDTVAPTSPTLTRASEGGPSYCPEELWLAWTPSTDDVDPATQIDYEVRVNGLINEVIRGGTQTVAYTEVFGANVVTVIAVDAAGNASASSPPRTVATNWGAGC